MDEIELESNCLGVILDKVSLNYIFCQVYECEQAARLDLEKRFADFSGRRIKASISKRGCEIAVGFPNSGWTLS